MRLALPGAVLTTVAGDTAVISSNAADDLQTAPSVPAQSAQPAEFSRRRLRDWLGLADKPTPASASFHLARFLILRLLGLIYLTGFAIILFQGLPLLGEHGLLPVSDFTAR